MSGGMWRQDLEQVASPDFRAYCIAPVNLTRKQAGTSNNKTNNLNERSVDILILECLRQPPKYM